MADAQDHADPVRLDVWLDVACLFKTRSGSAEGLPRGGKVAINRRPVKPNRLVRVGDEIEITRPQARKQLVVVRALADRHVARAEARALYEDLTPAPTPEEIALRRMERIYRAAMTPPRAPPKRPPPPPPPLKRGGNG